MLHELHIVVFIVGAVIGFPLGYRQAVKDGSGAGATGWCIGCGCSNLSAGVRRYDVAVGSLNIGMAF